MNQFIFNDKGTWDDYGLSLDPGYLIPEAPIVTYYVDVPERSGCYDLTESLNGMLVYGDRKGFKASFTLIKPRVQCEQLRRELTNDLHGKEVRVKSPLDSSHYFKGRLSVGALTFERSTGHIEITGQLDPYRYKNELTYVNASSTEEQTINLQNEQMPTTVKMVTTAQINIKHGTNNYSFNAGTHTLPFALLQGDNELKIKGAAEVIFEYQEGAL